MTLTTAREDFLIDMLVYYLSDMKNRICVHEFEQKGCYSPITAEKPLSEGCAIGRKLSKKLQLELDNIDDFGISVHSDLVFLKLPKKLQKLGKDFLLSCQNLHDNGFYFHQTSNLLLKEDLEHIDPHVKPIIKKFNLTDRVYDYKSRLPITS